MVTVGSVSREEATTQFEFLAQRYSGRRSAIRDFTHSFPEFVFWIYPDGRLHNARDSHLANVPRGFAWITRDEPEYGGFLRGRVARYAGRQLVVIYCRPEALAIPGPAVIQFLQGVSQVPVAVEANTLVISDNGDLYGTYSDLQQRGAAEQPNSQAHSSLKS
jgi:hypothetical protein